MNIEREEAEGLLEAVAVLVAAPTVLWMVLSMGEASRMQMVDAATSVVSTLAEPDVGLTILIAVFLVARKKQQTFD